MGIKKGQITKPEVVSLNKSMDDFEANIAERRTKLPAEFQTWLANEIADLRKRIDAQDHLFSLQSQAKHIAGTFLRMESGEITGVTKTGGFRVK